MCFHTISNIVRSYTRKGIKWSRRRRNRGWWRPRMMTESLHTCGEFDANARLIKMLLWHIISVIGTSFKSLFIQEECMGDFFPSTWRHNIYIYVWKEQHVKERVNSLKDGSLRPRLMHIWAHPMPYKYRQRDDLGCENSSGCNRKNWFFSLFCEIEKESWRRLVFRLNCCDESV